MKITNSSSFSLESCSGKFPPNDFNPSETDDPNKIYAEYNTLQAKCPLAYTDQYAGFWLLTRYDDVKRAAMDGETFISSVKAVVPSDPRGIRRPPLNFDAPQHTPFRTALDRTLKPMRIKRLESVLESHAEAELRPMLEKGSGDICMEFGARFPAWVETEWLNLDQEKTALLATTAAGWVDAWRAREGETVTRHSTTLYDIAKELLAERKRNPRDPDDDPASSLLLECDSHGNPLREEHLIGALRQSLVVGMVAPPLLIGAMCNHLSKDQQLQTQLRDEPCLIPAAVEEFIRMYTPYRGFARTTTEDVELYGRTICPGQPVTLSYAAANRDESVFPNAGEFKLKRDNIKSHLGFGRGRHACAGMPLARMSLQVALKVLLRNSTSFAVKGSLGYARMPEMGIISCPIVLTVRK